MLPLHAGIDVGIYRVRNFLLGSSVWLRGRRPNIGWPGRRLLGLGNRGHRCHGNDDCSSREFHGNSIGLHRLGRRPRAPRAHSGAGRSAPSFPGCAGTLSAVPAPCSRRLHPYGGLGLPRYRSFSARAVHRVRPALPSVRQCPHHSRLAMPFWRLDPRSVSRRDWPNPRQRPPDEHPFFGYRTGKSPHHLIPGPVDAIA
jgi:hypothetical protein